MLFNEPFTLPKHTAETTARVIYPALVRRDHFHQELHDTARCIELATFLAFGTGKLAREAIINPN